MVVLADRNGCISACTFNIGAVLKAFREVSSGEAGIWQINAMIIAQEYWENGCLSYL